MSIRKFHVEFLLAFFVSGNSSVIKDFLEKASTRHHMGTLFPGLIYDGYDVVQLTLATINEKLVNNLAVSKTSKMKLFSVHNLKHILALFGWKGPKGLLQINNDRKKRKNPETEDLQELESCLDENDVDYQAELESIRQITKSFFISVLTSAKKGLVCFAQA